MERSRTLSLLHMRALTHLRHTSLYDTSGVSTLIVRCIVNGTHPKNFFRNEQQALSWRISLKICVLRGMQWYHVSAYQIIGNTLLSIAILSSGTTTIYRFIPPFSTFARFTPGLPICGVTRF